MKTTTIKDFLDFTKLAMSPTVLFPRHTAFGGMAVSSCLSTLMNRPDIWNQKSNVQTIKLVKSCCEIYPLDEK